MSSTIFNFPRVARSIMNGAQTCAKLFSCYPGVRSQAFNETLVLSVSISPTSFDGDWADGKQWSIGLKGRALFECNLLHGTTFDMASQTCKST